ncbi:MAG: neutral/alkaline non-lysosomal ceramidase N-terminal domain-containing protein [Deltaproteobacteria bacterium]|nr:neutral/alkaline non-lysosomal ceramidase N-terminal domain-containing protein [Deltaproteobacteria bacterium]
MHRLLSIALIGLLSALGCNGSNDGPADSGLDAHDGGTDCTRPCRFFHECADSEDCVEGCCRGSPPCSKDVTCQPEGKCIDGRCVRICVTDLDCPDGSLCFEGFCELLPDSVLEAFLAPDVDAERTQRQTLQMGIGDVPLDFPVGVSMAGFGARLGPRTPYRKTLGGSDSMWDRPRVKAFVFDDGLKRIALVRTATSWSTDFMLSHAAWRIYQATGDNYLNRLVLSANHSHSYPGRYSFWVPRVQMGVLGHGDFSMEIFGRHTQAIADAVLMAIEDLKPARFAYSQVEAMDPEGWIHHDRREADGKPMDDSLYVLRVDDAEGNPRAVLFDFALHGTHSDTTTVTGDAPGAVEILAEQRLQEMTGLPVVAAFLSGCSGDVSPAGDGTGLDDWRKIQEVGEQAWPLILAEFERLEGQTSEQVAIDIANLRAPVSREFLGYGPGEFIDDHGVEFHFGAFQCVGSCDEDPATMYEDGALDCIFSLEMLSGGVPVPSFCKAHFTALRFGRLGLVTLPGEPLGVYGRDAAQALLEAADDLDHVAVLGYSQDHHLYLMHADNWLQGCYEPSMGIWGWREGDYYLEKSAELSARFAAEGGFTDDAGLMPSWYEYLDDTVPPTRTDPEEVGSLLQDTPASIERLQQIAIIWTGGHPGVDLPRMTLERETGGDWEKVRNAAGVVYSDNGHSTMLWYLGDYDLDHSWKLAWEEHIDFPTGRYRIHIDGHFFDGAGVQPYSLDSAPFDLLPSSRMPIAGVVLDASQLSGAVLYPAGPTNDDGQSAFDGLAARGFLRHTAEAPPQMPWPVPADGSVTVTARIQPPSGEPVDCDAMSAAARVRVDYTYVNARDGQGGESQAVHNLAATGFEGAHGAYAGPGLYSLEISAADPHGNTGSARVELELD